eukprot:scaffold48733_cov31-Tisochrysis_lutea.AAC.1
MAQPSAPMELWLGLSVILLAIALCVLAVRCWLCRALGEYEEEEVEALEGGGWVEAEERSFCMWMLFGPGESTRAERRRPTIVLPAAHHRERRPAERPRTLKPTRALLR